MLRPFIGLLFLTAASGKDYRDQPCKTAHVTQSCKWVHGRLSTALGTPAIRLWQVRTRHVYGIYSNQYGFDHESQMMEDQAPDSEAPELHFPTPKESPDHLWAVYGDFEICTLEPRIQGHMQAVCIAHATRVIAENE